MRENSSYPSTDSLETPVIISEATGLIGEYVAPCIESFLRYLHSGPNFTHVMSNAFEHLTIVNDHGRI
jgi:hypothetical protein